ncbi:probable RNA 3'-terminal phosphate cyclase-like protein [Fopius arisanus]|uniref:Probable RNA 3'-terminal phosphate cyclase-like protein n=1 Tax=Fopius arisanus TaxID=64838 RepID=A0A9R1T6W5_9HYME|nr:PREDICTED: probable RNA 3'-terminal phosphate cyclase-like protein [Fopius arisanus]
MPAQKKSNVLSYEGCNYLKYRLLLSTLSGKPVRIEDIRTNHDDPGLKEYEVSLIRLLDRLTNGTRVELNETGTSLFYSPGLLVGGELEHECSLQRGIGYYLEAVMALAPFCKKPVEIKLRGITNNSLDPSVDRIKTAGLSVLKRFVIGEQDVELVIKKRGAAPLGGGEVLFKCPIKQSLKTVQFQNSGMVKRIRGLACSIRVSPAIANRMVESAKGVLLNFLPDIYIHTDHCRGGTGGKSPGFGITITAETTNGVFFSGEACSPLMTTGSLPCVPEDIGTEAAHKLLDEIYRNGCVDSPFQSMTALFMALGKKDVSKVLVGPLTPTMIQFLRDLKDFFGVVFKLEPAKDEEDDEITLEQVLLTCVGIGYTNLSKKHL